MTSSDPQLSSHDLASNVVVSLFLSTFGGVFGGSIGALLGVGFTELLKAMLAVVSRQSIWLLVLVPLLGLTLSVLVLYQLGLSSEEERSQRSKRAALWRCFPD